MNQDDKLNYISEILSSENEPLPASLKKENVVSMLDSVGKKQNGKARIIPFKRYASVAAALVIIVSAAVFGVHLKNVGLTAQDSEEKFSQIEGVMPEIQPETSPAIYYEDDYSEIENYFISQHKKTVKQHQETADETGDDLDKGYTVFANNNINSTMVYGKTNTQVDGVDESDIIKNDGKYIYIVKSKENAIKIYIVDAAEMKQVSVIDVIPEDEKNEKSSFTAKGIYVSGDKLTVILNKFEYETRSGDDMVYAYNDVFICANCTKSETHIISYDISDRSQPKKLTSHAQSGDYQSSRMIGDILYTITVYGVDVGCDKNENEIKTECVPKIDGQKIKVKDIKFDKSDSDSEKSYVVISSFDIDENGGNDSSYAYLGKYAESIYATENGVYIVSTVNNEVTDYKNSDSSFTTEITKLSLSDGKISFEAKGKVPGRVNDNYSMDEHNGYFRIVTTDSQSKNNDFYDVSSVYVLDKKLKTVGSIVDIAKREIVMSVRFMGDTAYVITYENTDPLFVVDMSDPTAPKIIGKVELPGFSSYLHPVGEGYVVGVGYDGDDDGAEWDTVKVTLFDVTDPTKPKVAEEEIIKGVESDINYDTKAFMYYPEKQLIGIPTLKIDYIAAETDSPESKAKFCYSYKLINVENGKLTLTSDLSHNVGSSEESDFFRGTYISDTIYTLTQAGVCSFDIETGKLIKTLKLS